MHFMEETEKFTLHYKVVKCLPIYGMLKGLRMCLLLLWINFKNYNIVGK